MSGVDCVVSGMGESIEGFAVDGEEEHAIVSAYFPWLEEHSGVPPKRLTGLCDPLPFDVQLSRAFV